MPKLDKDSQKRLDVLTKEWRAEKSGFMFNTNDLRLLLEHSPLVQQLIRSIAQSSTDAVPASDSTHDSAADSAPAPAPASNNAYNSELHELRTRCQAAQRALTESNHTNTQLLQEKNNLFQQHAQLKQHNAQLQQQQRALEHELDQCQNELAQERKRRSHIPHAKVVHMLRQDHALASALSLHNLPQDDSDALIQIVAVLAQSDTIKRLWGILKERSETSQRPASDDECALLQTALLWCNHNWHTHPYSLNAPAAGTRFNFETQQRCKHTPSGETITSLLVPGINNGSGSVFCKPIVSTQS